MNDTLPYVDELDYLHERQRAIEVALGLMILLHLIYFIRRIRNDNAT